MDDEFDEIALIASQQIATLEALLAHYHASDKRGMLYSVKRSTAFSKAILLHAQHIYELREALYEQRRADKKAAG
jgi:hypothetical protein